MTKQEIKQAVLAAIDAGREEIFAVKDSIYQNPEFGYKEVKTTATVADFLEGLGLKVERNIAVTGCRARANEGKSGPHIAVMGELDGISCKEHKDANEIGASHTCGHNLQVAGHDRCRFGPGAQRRAGPAGRPGELHRRSRGGIH